MTAKKKAAAKKTGGAKGGEGTSGGGQSPAVQTNLPRNDAERAHARKTGVIRRDDARSADAGEKSRDRNHESNMVEVERMQFTRVVDGQRYGPFDKPTMVPRSIAETFGLTQTAHPTATSGRDEPTDPDEEREEAETMDSGDGVERLAGFTPPASDPEREGVTLSEIDQAAKDAGRDTESVLARRGEEVAARRLAFVESGAVEGSERERKAIGDKSK